VAVAILLATGAFGCNLLWEPGESWGEPDAAGCEEGLVMECPCLDGATGTQECKSDGTWGRCSCGRLDGGTGTDADDLGSDADVGSDGAGKNVDAESDADGDGASRGKPWGLPGSENPLEGWTPMWGSQEGDFEVVDGAERVGDRHLAFDSNREGRHALAWTDLGDQTDIDVVGLSRAEANDDEYRSWQRIYVRGSGTAGNEQAYWTAITVADQRWVFRLQKYTDGELVVLDEVAISDQPLGNWWYRRLQVEGDTLRARIWSADDPEPEAWMVEATDADYQKGWLAVGSFSEDRQQWEWLAVETDGGDAPLPDGVR